MWIFLLKTAGAFVAIIAAVRIMGKRQVGQLQVPELAITIIISQIATEPLINETMPFLKALAAVGLLVVLELGMSALTLASPRINKFFYGSPSFLMNMGKIDHTEMHRQRITVEDICEGMRQTGCPNPGELSCIVLETNGHMSIFLKKDRCEDGIPAVVIADGKINPNGLKFYGRNEQWLRDLLQSKGLVPEDVFLMTADAKDGVYIVDNSDHMR
ncbi:MAG TPA: DUF421 domain-containing protein [Oscillospiraceae bacterium]|nr:DUF421 domain-containing protein [Oscillospiraceae bacterium]HPS35562.1 DUF421 domain-containing protein [Oscillospiraceae bacterium]